MNKPILVVMAAGMGSRYGGLKQIDPVGPNGEIIIDYSLFDAKNLQATAEIVAMSRDLRQLRYSEKKIIEEVIEETEMNSNKNTTALAVAEYVKAIVPITI